MIVIIDNYDSFTYNLFQYVREFSDDVVVLKNDDSSILKLNLSKVDAFIFSPGPGKPSDTGLMPQLIEDYHINIPMFGICLGHQSIIEVFGGKIIGAGGGGVFMFYVPLRNQKKFRNQQNSGEPK